MKFMYFDYAAATPVSPVVMRAMAPFFSDSFFNPSAQYLAAQNVKAALNESRIFVAHELGCKQSEIIFTAGGTESDNLAIRGIMEQFPDTNCVVSAIEHDAVLEPAGQYDCRIAPVRSDGRIDLAALEERIDDRTVLVSVMYANNEIGTVQPLPEISILLKKIRAARRETGNKLPLYFHTDACQAANYLPLLVNSLGVDLMTLNGGKIYGPKQSGMLFVRTGTKLSPQILGGGQERNIRSGTENVAGIVGFAAALAETAGMRVVESDRLRGLQELFLDTLEKQLPQVVANGSREFRLPNNIHITIPGVDNERLMMELDERGLMVATGSACSASSEEPSHVLTAIGLDDNEARSSVRITFGRQTTEEEVTLLLEALAFQIGR